MSRAALSLAAWAEATCEAMSSILATLSACPASAAFTLERLGRPHTSDNEREGPTIDAAHREQAVIFARNGVHV
jgi:hypothetical protein